VSFEFGREGPKTKGIRAHWVGLSVVGHCGAADDDDDDDAVPRDVGWPAQTLLEVCVCRVKCDIEGGNGKICNVCIRRMKFKTGLMKDSSGVERYIR